MNIGICITDCRMQEIAHILAEKVDVYSIKNSRDLMDLTQSEKELCVLILPISGLSYRGEIQIQDELIPVLEVFKEKKLTIFAGKKTLYDVDENWKWVDLSNFDEIKQVNAELTAHGILDVLIRNTPRNFKSYSYDVLGYGACGKEIVHCLSQNECKVRLITRQKLQTSSIDWLDYDAWYKSCPSDIIINTASACVLKLQHLKQWKKLPWILDISSKGIGVEKEALNWSGGLLLPALPLISGATTSAEIMVKVIEKELKL